VPHRVSWSTPAGELVVLEARLADLETHVATLAAAYNDPRNASLLGHTAALDEADVRDHYANLLATGGRPFLLLRDGQLSGDADLRGFAGGAAEFAFLIADPGAQGRGLGTRFATMIHALAFARLGLERIYASVIPINTASRRVFEKLGYIADDSPEARDFADDDGDVTLRIDRVTFERLHKDALSAIAVR
jgi:RimJ/RimL family protein N-acetyltransferase